MIDDNIDSCLKNNNFQKITEKLNIPKEKHYEITCSVCLDEKLKMTIKLACKHIFCFKCIHKIKKSSNKCPLCRSDIEYTSYYLHD